MCTAATALRVSSSLGGLGLGGVLGGLSLCLGLGGVAAVVARDGGVLRRGVSRHVCGGGVGWDGKGKGGEGQEEGHGLHLARDVDGVGSLDDWGLDDCLVLCC